MLFAKNIFSVEASTRRNRRVSFVSAWFDLVWLGLTWWICNDILNLEFILPLTHSEQYKHNINISHSRFLMLCDTALMFLPFAFAISQLFSSSIPLLLLRLLLLLSSLSRWVMIVLVRCLLLLGLPNSATSHSKQKLFFFLNIICLPCQPACLSCCLPAVYLAASCVCRRTIPSEAEKWRKFK